MQKSDDDEKVELIVPISCLGKALRPRPGMSRQLHGASYNTEICALFMCLLNAYVFNNSCLLKFFGSVTSPNNPIE